MAYTKDQAWELLTRYNKGEFHLKHANTVADVMRWYAEQLGYGDEADFWEIVGLLHDLDFEMYPDEHCIKSQQLMREAGLDTYWKTYLLVKFVCKFNIWAKSPLTP